MSIDQMKKSFAAFGDTALLNSGLNEIIFQDLLFGFCCILNELWTHFSSEHLRIHILLCWISPQLTVSLRWNSEFPLWHLVGGLINYECKEP